MTANERIEARERRLPMTVDDLLLEARAALPHRPSPIEALDAQARGSLLVDIRGDDQRDADGLIPGAVVVPRNSLEWRCDPASPWRHPAVTDWDQPLILICNEGFQSSLAAATLQRLGLVRATDVDGGFVAWKATGLPLVPTVTTQEARTGAHPESTRGEEHWNNIYRRQDSSAVSWAQTDAHVSLELLDLLGVRATDAVVDVGGGASRLAATLVKRGFKDLTVLDCSRRALTACRQQLGSSRRRVRFLCQDLLDWQPERSYALWHDRALFHFFVDPEERARYVQILKSVVTEGGGVIIGTFAPDGPERCSGLPVMRYSASQMQGLLGDGFHLVADRLEDHLTPQGTAQRFSWAAFVRSRPAGNKS